MVYLIVVQHNVAPENNISSLQANDKALNYFNLSQILTLTWLSNRESLKILALILFWFSIAQNLGWRFILCLFLDK